MASTYTANNELEKPGQGEQNGVWSVPVNRNFDKTDAVASKVTTIGLTSNPTISTSRTQVAQFDSAVFRLTGDLNALAADRTVTLPDGKSGQWLFDFTSVTFGTRKAIIKTAGETNGVTITSASDTIVHLYSNGTSVRRVGEQSNPYITGEIRAYIPPNGDFDADLLPSGWFICDGNNGTPDLTSRFLYGASDPDNYGAATKTGGSSADTVSLGTFTYSGNTGSKSLTVNTMPSHNHLMFSVAGLVQNTSNPTVSNLSGTTFVAANVEGNVDNYSYTLRAGTGTPNGGITKSTGGGASHNHSINISKSLGNVTVDTIPRYYRVCYIMYTGG